MKKFLDGIVLKILMVQTSMKKTKSILKPLKTIVAINDGCIQGTAWKLAVIKTRLYDLSTSINCLFNKKTKKI